MGKVGSCRRVKDKDGRLAQGEDEVRMIWKEYFEVVYNIDTQEQVSVYICGFDGIWRGNYFREEPFGRDEVELRVGKFKNGKAAGKDKVTKEMIKA